MTRNTVVRAMHDAGLATWFGGSLMGAVGLNGAASAVGDGRERIHVANVGWDRWTPVNAAGIAAHLIGSAGLLLANRGRVAGQHGVGANSVAKTVLTGAALGATAYSRKLGAKLDEAGEVPAEGGVQPAEDTPPEVAKAQRQLRVLQWVIPGLTGTLVVLSSLHGEQQRPGEVVRGMLRNAFPMAGTRSKTGMLSKAGVLAKAGVLSRAGMPFKAGMVPRTGLLPKAGLLPKVRTPAKTGILAKAGTLVRTGPLAGNGARSR